VRDVSVCFDTRNMPESDQVFFVEVDLDPNGLSCDATDALVRCLAAAVERIPTPQWKQLDAHRTWQRRAAELVDKGMPPLPPGFSIAQQATNLAATVSIEGVDVSCARGETPDHVERAIEWFERHTGLSVGRLAARETTSGPGVTGRVLVHTETAVEGCRYSLSIPEGRPHPKSKGEQRLYERIQSDPALQGQFSFNEPVQTRNGRAYRVDLWHRDLRFAVEIDGYHYHRSREAFFSDRHRDYEMMVSGFLTLRIDHEEIERDLESVIGKIRDVMEFRRASSIKG